jgi:hypothetical protein
VFTSQLSDQQPQVVVDVVLEIVRVDRRCSRCRIEHWGVNALVHRPERLALTDLEIKPTGLWAQEGISFPIQVSAEGPADASLNRLNESVRVPGVLVESVAGKGEPPVFQKQIVARWQAHLNAVRFRDRFDVSEVKKPLVVGEDMRPQPLMNAIGVPFELLTGMTCPIHRPHRGQDDLLAVRVRCRA